MRKKNNAVGICQITGKSLPKEDLVGGASIREPIIRLIKQKYPGFDTAGYISVSELNHFRHEYIRTLVVKEKGELDQLENEVLEHLHAAEIISRNVEEDTEAALGLGDRISDRVARFGGSWTFILTFFAVLIVWLVGNSLVLLYRPFDPYPFILLNLILSCIAAIQAPIIMMSQNRQESKDRLRSEHDYQVNLKSELEIRQLHEKLDHLITRQVQRLLEIQEVQLEYLEDILEGVQGHRGKPGNDDGP